MELGNQLSNPSCLQTLADSSLVKHPELNLQLNCLDLNSETVIGLSTCFKLTSVAMPHTVINN